MIKGHSLCHARLRQRWESPWKLRKKLSQEKYCLLQFCLQSPRGTTIISITYLIAAGAMHVSRDEAVKWHIVNAVMRSDV